MLLWWGDVANERAFGLTPAAEGLGFLDPRPSSARRTGRKGKGRSSWRAL